MSQDSFMFDEQDRAAAIDAQIVELLHGLPQPPLEEGARAVLHELRYAKGAAHAVPLATLAGRTKLSEREIKAAVSALVITHRVRVGSSRGAQHGYFLIVTADDVRRALRPFAGELRAIVERMRVIGDEHNLVELLGQLAVKLEAIDTKKNEGEAA